MKKLNLFLLTGLMLSLTSCELAGSLVKGGIYIGAIGVILVVALIVWLVSKARR